jgi:hypothetical protein
MRMHSSQAGFLHRAQPVLRQQNAVGELMEYPCISRDKDNHKNMLFQNVDTLFYIDLARGEEQQQSLNKLRQDALNAAMEAPQTGSGSDNLGSLLSPITLASRVSAFMIRVPDKRQMRHRAICKASEADINGE